MNGKRMLPILLAVIGLAGAVFSVVMLVAAVRSLEWGRVVLYCVTLVLCVELVVLNILKLKPAQKDK